MPHTDPDAKRAYDAARYRANAEAVKQRSAARHRANPEQTQRYTAAFRERNPLTARLMAFCGASNRRARKMGCEGWLFVADLRPLVGPCAYCGSPAGAGFFDHVTPLYHGGANLPENLLPCCGDCNRYKGARLPSWRELALLRRFLAARGIHSATRSSPLPSRSQRRPTPERNRS